MSIPSRDLDPRAHYARQINDALHRPDPTLGWTGDPDLFAVYHRIEDRWEVWRSEEMGDRLVARCPSGRHLDITVLLKGLVERDTHLRNNSAIKQMEAVIEHNERVEAERERKAVDRLSETMERVYHAAVYKSGEYGYVAPVSLSGAWKGE